MSQKTPKRRLRVSRTYLAEYSLSLGIALPIAVYLIEYSLFTLANLVILLVLRRKPDRALWPAVVPFGLVFIDPLLEFPKALVLSAILILTPYLAEVVVGLVIGFYGEWRADSDIGRQVYRSAAAYVFRVLAAVVTVIASVVADDLPILIATAILGLLFVRSRLWLTLALGFLVQLALGFAMAASILVTLSGLMLFRRYQIAKPFSIATPYKPSLSRFARPLDWLSNVDRAIANGNFTRARRIIAPRASYALDARLRLAFLDLHEGNYQDVLDASVGLEVADSNQTQVLQLIRAAAIARFGGHETAMTMLRSLLNVPAPSGHFRAFLLAESVECASNLGLITEVRRLEELLSTEYRRRQFPIERLRAKRIASQLFQSRDELERANDYLVQADEIVYADPWLRTLVRGKRSRLNSTIVGRRARVWVELLRLEVQTYSVRSQLEADFESDLDIDAVTGVLALAGAWDALAEVNLLAARSEAVAERFDQAQGYCARALMELDQIRYTLQSPSDRTLWSHKLLEAIRLGASVAMRSSNPEMLAQLLEFARVQTVPAARAVEPGDVDNVRLSVPPVITVRGRSRLSRPGNAMRPEPLALEAAAEMFAGPEAWWLAYWSVGDELVCVATPPNGELSWHAIRCGPGSRLQAALKRLETALPMELEDETVGEYDLRLYHSPLMAKPFEEAEIFMELGHLLLPRSVASEAQRKVAQGERLKLAVSAAPSLGFLPWSLLVVPMDSSLSTTRLVDCCDWVLAPSSALAVNAETSRAVDQRLRIAVADTWQDPVLGELPAARAEGERLPQSVRLLGGRHWAEDIATITEVERAFMELAGSGTVAFMCHAVRDRNNPYKSGIILAPQESTSGQPSVLSASAILDMARRGIPMPRQVLLQACDTSALSDSTSGEWLTVAPSFLAAGCEEVVATLFPIPDAGYYEDAMMDAAINGESLRLALSRIQRENLERWESGRAKSVGEAPLCWAAYAPLALLRGPSDEARGHATPGASARTVLTLDKAIRDAGGILSSEVTSAHFMLAYLELYSDQILVGGTLSFKSLFWVLGGNILGRVLRERNGKGRQVSDRGAANLSNVLEEAMKQARDQARRDGLLVEPEHVILCSLDSPRSAAVRLLRVMAMARLQRIDQVHNLLLSLLADSVALDDRWQSATMPSERTVQTLARVLD